MLENNKLKVLYIIDQEVGSGLTEGIIHKIKDKIDQWEPLGAEVQILSLYSFKLYDNNLSLINDKFSFSIEKHSKLMTLFRLAYTSFLLWRHLGKFKFDLIYMRTRPYMPFIRIALKKYKVVMEINSDDIAEWKNQNKIMYHYNNLTRNRFFNLADAFVSVSHELTKKFEKFSKPIITIGNGVLPNKYIFEETVDNSRPKICFVGSPGFAWHGIEHIKYLATQIKGADFHIIGEEGADQDNIKFHGYLNLIDTQNLVSTCDAAISTLALYRKDMDEASPLKSRQYLAQGIPFIYGYQDTDLEGSESFALRIPNNAKGVETNLKQIQDFINLTFKNNDLRKQARTFASDYLNVAAKEKIRLQFLKNL